MEGALRYIVAAIAYFSFTYLNLSKSIFCRAPVNSILGFIIRTYKNAEVVYGRDYQGLPGLSPRGPEEPVFEYMANGFERVEGV